MAKRLTEPSTYVALGALGGIFGVPALALLGVPEVATQLASLAALVVGMFLPEKGTP